MQALTASPAIRVAMRLRDGEPATLTDLAGDLALSRTSVETAMLALQEAGLTREVSAPGAKGAGRPARHFAFDADAGLVAAVDVGAHSVRVLLSDLAGRVIAQNTAAGIDSDDDAATQIAAVIAHVRAALDALPERAGHLRALGVSLPGIVDDAGRVVASVVLPAWSGVDVAAQLRAAFGCPVAIDNGVRLAAVAEHHLGAARLVDDVLYLSVGARIAAGILLGGRPRRGAHNVAGDIGRVAFRGLDERTGAIPWHSATTAQEVFERSRAGDEQARGEIAAFVEELARGLAMLVMTVDPAIIVIGGGLSLASDHLLGPLRDALVRHIGLPITVPIVAARLGADAAVHGALVLAFTRCADDVFRIAGMPAPAIQPRDAAILTA